MTHPVIHAYRRQQLEQWIERAIALLDSLDGDPDLEDGGDRERDDAEHDSPGGIRGGSDTEIISDLPASIGRGRQAMGGRR